MHSMHLSFLFLLIFGVLKNEVLCFETNSYGNQGDYTHANITRGAFDKAAAYYIANIIEPGHYDLHNQTTDEILRLYFSKDKEAERKYDDAVDAVVEGLERASNDKKLSAKFTMNNEMIVEGVWYLFTKRTAIDSLTRETSVDWFMVRMLVGEFLFTLQDFYSNTNWIEMGKGVLHSLGWNSTIDFPIARPGQPTCDSCRLMNGTSNGTCHHNLLVNNVLTSGYIDWSNGSSVKPYDQQWSQGQGKCSHGGVDDGSRFLPATGGINKESTSPLKSPHYYLHSKAGKVATDATTDFLIRNESSLLTALGYVLFGKLIGLDAKSHQSQQCVNCNDPSASMVFVIDTTGSMATDIFNARKYAVQVVAKAQMPGFSPANYILVTFNDPASKTTYRVTTNGTEMKSWLNALTVDGGGDCPEYALSGLTTAMSHARNGSCVFLFTDADPKDPELQSDVIRYIKSKNLHLVSIITGQCNGALQNSISHSGSTSGSSSGSTSSSGDGGIGCITEKYGYHVCQRIQQSLSNDDLAIQVDSRITAFTVEISRASTNPSGSLFKPDGTADTFSGKSSFNDVGRSTYIMSVVNPNPGLWILKNTNADSWSVSVKQQGDIEFTAKLLTGDSLTTVFGNPIAGASLKLMVRVSDLLLRDTLTTGILLDDNRREITRINLTESNESRRRIGIGSFTVPNDKFRVAIEGMESGHLYRRVSKNIFTPSSATLDIVKTEDVLYVGKDNNIQCKVTNLGSSTEMFTLRISDTAGLLSTTRSVTVTPGNTVSETFVLHPKSGGPISTELTAELILSGTKIQEERKPFMIQSKLPPKITVKMKSPFCSPLSLNYFNCSLEVLNVSVVVLMSSPIKALYTKPLFDIDMRNHSLNYTVMMTGSCCRPIFTLFALDTDLLQSELSFDFTNGQAFSNVIPDVHTVTKLPVKSNKTAIYYAIGGASAAAVLFASVAFAVFKLKTVSKITDSLTCSRPSVSTETNSRPRMPRSHFEQFVKK